MYWGIIKNDDTRVVMYSKDKEKRDIYYDDLTAAVGMKYSKVRLHEDKDGEHIQELEQ